MGPIEHQVCVNLKGINEIPTEGGAGLEVEVRIIGKIFFSLKNLLKVLN